MSNANDTDPLKVFHGIIIMLGSIPLAKASHLAKPTSNRQKNIYTLSPVGGGLEGHREKAENEVIQLVSWIDHSRHPPAMQETLFQFLGWEDPLEKG